MTRSMAITLVLFAMVLGLSVVRYAPPAVREGEAPAGEFSVTRAREVQAAIAGDGASRAIGSEANARAREWLRAELARSGWDTELQVAVTCGRHGVCGRVVNIVASRAGREPEAGGVLLMAHYDSVPSGPGASDDGVGTSAVIEAARAIGASPRLRRNVVVVLTDGEEPGLLGAEAFVREHPLAKTARGAVNIDARGSRGPSATFETSAGNGWLIGLLARSAERPVTSSLFYEIYRRMPNDTDFTSVKDRVHGVNFANIAGVEHYHTPLDSLERADPRTLQHHGDQALAMVRALADAGPELDAPRDRSHDAVWFDVMATFIVRWPVAAALGLALGALALIAGWTIRMRAWGGAIAAAGAALGAALIAALAVGFVMKMSGGIPVPWVAHPLPALLALHGSSMAAGIAAAWFIARRGDARVAWAGTWLTWGVLGVATAIVAPGASFLFVAPTFMAGLVAWLRIDLASILAATAAAVLWMPVAVLVYDGLGLVVPLAVCISSVMLVTTLPALLADANGDAKLGSRSLRRWLGGAAGAVALAVIVAALVPKYSVEKPQRVNVIVRQDEGSQGEPLPSRIYVEAAWAHIPWGDPPPAMLRALGDPDPLRTGAPTPWSSAVPFAEGLPLAIAGPQAVVSSSSPTNGGWSVRALVRSRRGARTIGIVLPPDRRAALTVEGQPAFPRNGAVWLRGVPDEGLEISLTADEPKPIELTVFDATPGVPAPVASDAAARALPDGASVRAARPAHAAQSQEGDVTISARIVKL